MSNLLEPAASIIARFGGADRVQLITGASRTRVYRWTQPVEAGGTGGAIPMKPAIKLLAHAREHSLPITADDFLGEAA